MVLDIQSLHKLLQTSRIVGSLWIVEAILTIAPISITLTLNLRTLQYDILNDSTDWQRLSPHFIVIFGETLFKWYDDFVDLNLMATRSFSGFSISQLFCSVSVSAFISKIDWSLVEVKPDTRAGEYLVQRITQCSQRSEDASWYCDRRKIWSASCYFWR